MAKSASTPALSSCPTRIDNQSVLFAHMVTESMCQERQRDQYHKCFTCVHNNRVRGIAPAREVKR